MALNNVVHAPELDDITSDSRYLGSLLTLGAVAYMSPALLPHPADIDTLQIKGVYLELDTTAIPDPTAAKNRQRSADDVPDLNVTTISNVNTCINKVVIPTWGHDGLENTILYWFEVPMAKNNAFIVKNFGLWAFAK
eukprot:tig00000552_g2059.t1